MCISFKRHNLVVIVFYKLDAENRNEGILQSNNKPLTQTTKYTRETKIPPKRYARAPFEEMILKLQIKKKKVNKR